METHRCVCVCVCGGIALWISDLGATSREVMNVTVRSLYVSKRGQFMGSRIGCQLEKKISVVSGNRTPTMQPITDSHTDWGAPDCYISGLHPICVCVCVCVCIWSAVFVSESQTETKLKSTQDTQSRCVCRKWKFWLLSLVVHTVTTGL